MTAWTKFDEFSENFRRRGVISHPKKFVVVFSVILRGKSVEFSVHSEKLVTKKHNLVFRNEGVGGESSKAAFRKFIEFGPSGHP